MKLILSISAAFVSGMALATPTTWLYCKPVGRFYPYTQTCPVPWIRVQPNAQPNGGMALPQRPRVSTPAQMPAYPSSPDPAAQQAAQAKQAAQAAEERKREAAAAEARKEKAEAAARAAADRKARLDEQRKDDEAQGFKETTISDIRVDYKDMSEETKVIVTGLYSNLGQIAMLSEDYMGNSVIYIMSDQLPRETRKRILSCDGCRVTIWAHYGCTMTVLNQQTGAPCFIADRLRMGGYGLVDDE